MLINCYSDQVTLNMSGNNRNWNSRQKLEENHTIYEKLIIILTIENSRNVIKEFGMITNHCLPQQDEELTIIPGYLDEDFRRISIRVGDCSGSMKFSKLISNISNLMDADELSSICNNLPEDIDNDKLDIVKKYGKTAGSLYDKFSTLQKSLENGFKQLQISYLPSAPSSQNRAIEQ
ncbi:hypothetical protein B9Z55_018859 [Caenorhabditis nigoni]|nr:hypothetical protein B9Z55_018859 [Caenorhabditis nigoni]